MGLWHVAVVAVFVVSVVQRAVGNNESCLKVTTCLDPTFRAAMNMNDPDIMCRLGQKVVVCLEAALEKCNNEAMYSMGKQQVDILKGKLGQCNREPEQSDCVQSFSSCVSSDIQHASEHENTEVLCREGPSKVDCLENVLTNVCKMNSNNPEAQEMKTYLDKMKRDILAQCNHGNSVLTSILLTCTAVVLTILLHKV